MSDTPTTPKVTLPGIQEMLPDHLFQPSKRIATVHGTRLPSAHVDPLHAPPQSYGGRRGMNMVIDPTKPPQHHTHAPSTAHPASPPFNGLSPSLGGATPTQSSPASSNSSFDVHDLYLTSPHDRRDSRAEERRHVCQTCSKAFNRPSSLEIHNNIHTGEKPFECPFPGCGKTFNVNSNMRRHLRNHLSPSRSTASSPYTYPLTTSPPSLSSTGAYLPAAPGYDAHAPMSRPRPSTVSSSPSIYTDSEDEHEFYAHLSPVVSHLDNDVEIQEASARMKRLRLRSYSSPGVRPPYDHTSLRYPSHRRTSSSCTVPGCRCIARPM